MLVQVDTETSKEEDDRSPCQQSATVDASFVDSINCWVIARLVLQHISTYLTHVCILSLLL